MRYFKIKTGFKDEDFIPITENELEAALYAFMTDSKVIFDRGMINGKNIISITEDWHRAMGWNTGYKLGPEDFSEINKKCGDYVGLIALVKENVQQLIREGKTNLIGKRDYSQVRTLSSGDKKQTDELHIMRNLPGLSGAN